MFNVPEVNDGPYMMILDVLQEPGVIKVAGITIIGLQIKLCKVFFTN